MSRDRAIHIRLDDAELEELDVEAKKQNLSRGELARNRVLRRHPPRAPQMVVDPFALGLITELTNVCAGIRQELERLSTASGNQTALQGALTSIQEVARTAAALTRQP